MAQSIVTDCGPDLFQTSMTSFASVLNDDGLVLFSYWNTPVELPKGAAQRLDLSRPRSGRHRVIRSRPS